jgi:hypothetical protein
MKSFSLDESNPAAQHAAQSTTAPTAQAAHISTAVPLAPLQQPPQQPSIQLQHQPQQSIATSTSLVPPLPVNQQLLNANPTSQCNAKSFPILLLLLTSRLRRRIDANIGFRSTSAF